MRVDSSGDVAVTYYDFRNNTSAPGALADYWVVRSHGGYTNPANWGDEIRLTNTSFDTEKAPNAEGYFLTRATMEWFCGHYLADSAHGRISRRCWKRARERQVSRAPPPLRCHSASGAAPG